MPVAVNCSVVPLAIAGAAGVTAIDMSCAPETVSIVEPMIVPIVAVMFVVPGATPVATPAVEIVATVVMLEALVTIAVRFIVVWSS